MFLVSVLCFLVFSVIRGDPASLLGGLSVTQEQLEILREDMGLNQNVFVRYGNWLADFIKGNPGNSFFFQGEAISDLIAERLPVSFSLAILSLFFVLLIAMIVSLFSVKQEGGILDRVINFFTAAAISVPGFFLGLIFIFIFGFTFHFFIPGEYISYEENIFAFLRCLFFPSLAIAIPSSAVLVKFLRASIFSEWKNDYVRTARSKGARRFYILRRHVFKNAIIPSITITAMIIAEVLSGSIIIEQVFSFPGIGRLLIAAISSRDYPLIQALMVYIAFIVIAVNTFADIVIMILDPRIRLSKEAAR
jgi:ABC-type dipeptide/oligopeptide/nickel transport system permease component